MRWSGNPAILFAPRKTICTYYTEQLSSVFSFGLMPIIGCHFSLVGNWNTGYITVILKIHVWFIFTLNLLNKITVFFLIKYEQIYFDTVFHLLLQFIVLFLRHKLIIKFNFNNARWLYSYAFRGYFFFSGFSNNYRSFFLLLLKNFLLNDPECESNSRWKKFGKSW